ncbi:unnamed protein product [Effrenium voratum]|nr:unnamed protein product [Effrenium voratum]CAJ1345234.1 unnamed protein product [Effrenium voratum]CAJ1345235.1 unnamed protein product [Effrenium voratum]
MLRVRIERSFGRLGWTAQTGSDSSALIGRLGRPDRSVCGRVGAAWTDRTGRTARTGRPVWTDCSWARTSRTADGSDWSDSADGSVRTDCSELGFGRLGRTDSADGADWSDRLTARTPRSDSLVTLPREMRHFLALLKVHRFEQKSSFLAIRDVVQAIVDFGEDMELARFGVKSLMSGVPLEQEMRMPTIARCPGFVAAIRRMLQKETHPDAFYLVSRLILGILDNDPTDYEGWVDVAALTVAKMLQVTGSWTSTAWEVMLQIIAEALRTPQGKQLVFNFNIVLALTKAWDKLRSNDDTLSKMLISSYHDQTERTLEMLT